MLEKEISILYLCAFGTIKLRSAVGLICKGSGNEPAVV